METAVATLTLMIVLWMCLGGITAGLAYVKCVDAAREAALGVARGDPGAVERARGLAPQGARFEVDTMRRGLVSVRVDSRSRAFPLLRISADTVAAVEEWGG